MKKFVTLFFGLAMSVGLISIFFYMFSFSPLMQNSKSVTKTGASENIASYVKSGITFVLPESVNSLLKHWSNDSSFCESLNTNIDGFNDYLNKNKTIVSLKGMNGIEDQLQLMRTRVEKMPMQMKDIACKQEIAKLDGLKSVFFLGGSTI
nr:hypothetical protein [uncultured Moellerella sp.]